MVNDSAYNIAPTTSQLLTYAKSLGLNWDTIKLSESGYRIFKNSQYEFLVDVGNIGPTYQPGHAHSDTFNFELHINNTPIIVDTGISTYEKNAIRQNERSTSAHNTVQIGSAEQSEIWGGFRVGRRAKIISFEEDETIVKASHDGYKSFGITHERAFKVSDNEISIKDKLSNSTNLLQKAYFHFHPDVTDLIVKDHSISVKNSITINLKGSTRIEVSDYQYATGFNKTKKAKKITIYFDRLLKTQINI